MAGAAAPQEIRARYRTLAQRCASGEALGDERGRLAGASLALAQELAYLGHDAREVTQALEGEGCPADIAAAAAGAAAGQVSRVVPDPLERKTRQPIEAAYAQLAQRTASAESMRTATASSYGFGFIARLAIAFVLVVGALVAALDFFPRVLQAPKAAPKAPAPYPVELVPPSPPPAKPGAR